MQKPSRSDERIQQDYVTNKILIVFSAALLASGALMVLGSKFRIMTTTLPAYRITIVFLVAGIALIALGGALKYLEKRDRKDVSCRYVTGKHVLAIGVVLTLCMTYIYGTISRFGLQKLFEGYPFLYAFLIGLAALYLFFHSFQKEFFVIASASLLGAGLTWLARIFVIGAPAARYIVAYAVLTVAVAAAAAVLLLHIRSNDGYLGTKKAFDLDAPYLPMFLSIALMAAGTVLSCILGTGVAFYIFFGMLAYAFVWSVYFAVKLM